GIGVVCCRSFLVLGCAGVAAMVQSGGGARVSARVWSFEASLALLRCSIDRLGISPLAVIPPNLRVGNALPFTPRWQGHLGVAYTARALSLRITPRVDASYQSQTFFDATNTPEIAQLGGYTVLNASFAIAPDAGPWRLTA